MPPLIFSLVPQTSNTNDDAHQPECQTTNTEDVHQHDSILTLKDDGRHREEEGFDPAITKPTFTSDDLDTPAMTTHSVNTHDINTYIDSSNTSHVTFIFKDPSAPSVSCHELKAAATNNMAILGLTFDDDDPATTASKFDEQHANTPTVYPPSLPQNGEFTIPTIIARRSDHGEHITPVCETASLSLKMYDATWSIHGERITSTANAETTRFSAWGAEVYEGSWFLRKLKTVIEFPCGTMGSDKILCLLDTWSPP